MYQGDSLLRNRENLKSHNDIFMQSRIQNLDYNFSFSTPEYVPKAKKVG